MTRDELADELRATAPESDAVIYIERRGSEYDWERTGADTRAHVNRSGSGALPDAWIYYSGPWPTESMDRWQEFFDDLLEEMDSMSHRVERSRWPLGDPWPQRR
jgi:hypothetical protein